MKERRGRKGKRFRFTPFILGVYGAYLGLGLTAIGFSELTEGIGVVRLLLGLGLTGVGLLGIWDGVRDWIAPDQKPEKPAARQFILTDIHGKRSSNVTMELLRTQLEALAEQGEGASFHLQILPPVSIQERGVLRQISCVYQDKIAMIAFFEQDDEGFQVWRKEPAVAEEVLKQILEDRLDFSGWEKSTVTTHHENPTKHPRKCLRILGESWENRLQIFSARDVELAVKGVSEGKYRRIELELGSVAFYVFLSDEEESAMVLQMLLWSREKLSAFEKTGTPVQVNFWLIQMLNEGLPAQLYGWRDITTKAI